MAEEAGNQNLEHLANDFKGGTAGVLASAMAVVCQMAGMGILQLAYMLRQGGWICLVLIVGCALATNYTGKLLIRCCYDQGSRVHATYAEIGMSAFGAGGKACTQVFENATLFGVSTLFLILGGKFLEEILPNTLDTRMWIVVGGAVAAIPVLVFRTIGELKVVAFLGVAAVGAVVAAVVVEAFGAISDEARHSKPTDIILPGGLIPAFSAMALAFAAHAGLPHVESSMRDRAKFAKSFNIAYLLVMVLYLPVAVIGYAVYGNGVYSPILCSLPRDNWVQVAAKILVTLHVFLTYPVLMTLFLTEFEKSIQLQPGSFAYLPKRTALRGLLVAMTVLVAVFVPYFDSMMSLVGAVCVVMTTFVLPAAFFLKLRARTLRERVLPVVVAAIGLVGGSIGAVQAMQDLIQKVSSGADPNAG
mmetsp:Transcript_33465/g.53301  ORF Transcript_33465/g.53301 Transcript_33465/m.53301 type:complete len:417 (+) Transcript_33465:54-1304(+)|eukprot:CAMPEP_0169304552 /NCGR_PEP_ID=MMETSP1016-20121227/69941_1 /TAXON_ID=342587 /ORGANISM="Karlodinium micrum, Strain CCMP2283" /LENGTH=416 /DNA_ID=CAMNT_0009397431 /DNA_START=49 /DNA_END=1299 /DNA_ORIENTATION=-